MSDNGNSAEKITGLTAQVELTTFRDGKTAKRRMSPVVVMEADIPDAVMDWLRDRTSDAT